jgi:hypothetical protein
MRPYLTRSWGIRRFCFAVSPAPALGHRVAWHDSATDQGTVIATDWSGVQIEWDNGKTQFLTRASRRASPAAQALR